MLDHAVTPIRLGPPALLWERRGWTRGGGERTESRLLHGTRFLPGEYSRGRQSRPNAFQKAARRSSARHHPIRYADADPFNGGRVGRHGRSHPSMCIYVVAVDIMSLVPRCLQMKGRIRL